MATASTVLDRKISCSPGKMGMVIFGIVLMVEFAYAGSHLLGDLSTLHSDSVLPFVLLGVALLVALGVELAPFSTTRNCFPSITLSLTL